MSTSFRPHGSFTIRVDGRIIISDVTGPWNKELVDAWAVQVYPIAKELAATGPHAGIAIMHESMLCPPEALATLKLAVQYGVKKLGCVAQVIVASHSIVGRDLLETTYARIYQGMVPYRLFEEYDEALAWARKLVDDAM